MEPSTWSPPSWAALHRRDVTEAMRDRPTHHETQSATDIFLTKESMRTDWRLVSATEGRDPSPRDGLNERLVLHQDRRGQRCLCHRDGVRRRRSEPAGRPAPLAYSGAVRASDARPSRALNYLSVNGKQFKAPAEPTVFLVFPGTYVPASLAPALVTPTSSPLVVATAGGPRPPALSLPLRASVTPAATKLLRTQAKTLVNHLRPATVMAPKGCPFRGPSGTVDFTEYNTVLYNFTNPRWKVKEYPTFGAVAQTDDGGFVFTGGTIGHVTLNADALGPQPGTYTATMPCTVHPNLAVSCHATDRPCRDHPAGRGFHRPFLGYPLLTISRRRTCPGWRRAGRPESAVVRCSRRHASASLMACASPLSTAAATDTSGSWPPPVGSSSRGFRWPKRDIKRRTDMPECVVAGPPHRLRQIGQHRPYGGRRGHRVYQADRAVPSKWTYTSAKVLRSGCRKRHLSL